MSYEVTILQDSLHPAEKDARLTTFEVTFPRFILAEVNTHRMLSRNSGSSRAIPTETQIQSVLDNPFVPEFNARVKGMGVGDTLGETEQKAAQDLWLAARDSAVIIARGLIHVDKSRANRLLEPFLWHTAIISATEWGNFFALRTDEGAQPEFRIIAKMMEDALRDSNPLTLTYNDWHTPLIEGIDFKKYGTGHTKFPGYRGDWDSLKDIAAGRLARRSSYNRTDPEPDEKSIERTKILTDCGHWSPLEHIARPIVSPDPYFDRGDPDHWSGNFYGWHQYRKDFPYENDFSLKGSAEES
jgi:thymidylate synthase ThyX